MEAWEFRRSKNEYIIRDREHAFYAGMPVPGVGMGWTLPEKRRVSESSYCKTRNPFKSITIIYWEADPSRDKNFYIVRSLNNHLLEFFSSQHVLLTS